MNISYGRSLVLAALGASAVFDAAYYIYGGQHWHVAAVSCFLGAIFLLALQHCGLMTKSALPHSRQLLHLRCLRHPSAMGYCGTQASLTKFFAKHCRDSEAIFQVAIRHPSGRIYAAHPPARHPHVIALMSEYGDSGLANTQDQGFLTNHGRYVGREEAWVIAQQADQIKRTTGTAGTLYSEDLWAGPLLARRQLEEKAWELICQAIHSNQVVTIEHVPRPDLPVAPGNYEMIPHVCDSHELATHKAAQALKPQEAAA